MLPRSFHQISGLFLALSGALILIDTCLDAFAPTISPGLGALVPVFGLVGFPGFWASLNRTGPLTNLAYVMGMLGLAGLVAIMFLANRLFPDLPPQTVGQIAGSLMEEFTVIGVVFLCSALLLLPVCWNAGNAHLSGALLYAAGAIPVSLPTLMPDWLAALGAILIGAALITWGANMAFQRSPTPQAINA